MKLKRYQKIVAVFALIVVIGLILPQKFSMPVEGASKNSYHPESFWYYPWGRSGTHKGVDIFAKEGTHVNASVSGLVVYTGQLPMGGNVVLLLGPKWRFHYYAHLKEIKARSFRWKSRNEIIGTVGTTGNAKGKPAHLHYSIVTAVPYPWRIDNAKQGWKKMFFLNPIDYLK